MKPIINEPTPMYLNVSSLVVISDKYAAATAIKNTLASCTATLFGGCSRFRNVFI